MVVHGQSSHRLQGSHVDAWLTRLGGHLGPVAFRLGSRTVQPFSVAPWAEETHDGEPPVIRALRGDFFCMPFGANEAPFRGERHPLHGETANSDWGLEETAPGYLRLGLSTAIRKAQVTKELWLRDGETAIYSRHTIAGGSGPMTLGHHAMLKFPCDGDGLVSLSPFRFGQVFPGQFEDPARGGYSSLRPGARFTSLSDVPRADGGTADLSRYPAREGFEDLVMVYADPEAPFAWSAAVFQQDRYCWFALRDPRSLSGTILWHSNGGRHYSPWSGRHRRVLGIEDVTAAMHYGLAGSVAENDASREGYRTFLELDPRVPTVVSYIMGVVEIPDAFGHVRDIQQVDRGVEIVSATGMQVRVPLDLSFLEPTGPA
jgi:hypothetical protein